MTTGLPSTSNIWLIFIIGGLLLILFKIKNDENYKKFLIESINKTQDLSHEQNLIGLELDTLNQKNERKAKELKHKLLILDSKQQKINLKNNLQINSYDSQEIFYDIMYFLGIIILSLGIIKIFINQNYEDIILKEKFILSKIKSDQCQSCGMLLENDIFFEGKANFCSHCFQNGEFTNGNIKFEEFKDLVAAQLESKRFSKKEIHRHLSKLKNLKRWKKKFDWE